MPLPTNTADRPWPPPRATKMLADIDVAAAWWTGDTHELAAATGRSTARQENPRPGARFWERPVDQSGKDPRVHVPLAADIAQTGADLLFSEDPTWTHPDTATADRLHEIHEETGIGATLLEAAELAGALGGVYLRPTWDTATVDQPLLTVVNADRAIPTFRFGRLIEVVFWRELAIESRTGSQAVWRHLELHQPGRIFHGLYKGTGTHLGTMGSLLEHPETRDLPEEINLQALFDWSGLFAWYVPNVLPNRRLKGMPVGRPDTAGSESLMDSLDEAMSSWVRDLRLGKARLIVPDEFLTSTGRGQGSFFDQDREIFSPLAMDPAHAERAGITPVEFTIRTEEHAATVDRITEQVIRDAGYSPRSLGIGQAGGASTATEVRSDETASLHTTGRKQRYWRPALNGAGHALLAIDRGIFGRQVVVERPSVRFGEPIGADIREVASTLNLINLARAASIETRVRLLNPDWDQDTIAAEVAAIKAEEGVVADPTGGFP